jgi:hypothetical protein
VIQGDDVAHTLCCNWLNGMAQRRHDDSFEVLLMVVVRLGLPSSREGLTAPSTSFLRYLANHETYRHLAQSINKSVARFIAVTCELQMRLASVHQELIQSDA